MKFEENCAVQDDEVRLKKKLSQRKLSSGCELLERFVHLLLQIIRSNSSKKDRYEFGVTKMPLPVEIMWYTVFSSMLIIAIGGNIIVMWIVLGKWLSYLC